MIGGQKTDYPGGGAFRKSTPLQQLTEPEQKNRSLWQLPSWFSQLDGKGSQTFTYHRNSQRWSFDGNNLAEVQLQAVAKGQEFVLNLQNKSLEQANIWLEQLLKSQF